MFPTIPRCAYHFVVNVMNYPGESTNLNFIGTNLHFADRSDEDIRNYAGQEVWIVTTILKFFVDVYDVRGRDYFCYRRLF